MRKLLIGALVVTCSILQAQISFTNRSDLLGVERRYSGLVVGISDMNNDQYEDIIYLDKDRRLFISYQLSRQNTFYSKYIGVPTGKANWSLTIGDIDNNGFNDMVFGGNATGVKVWMMGALGEVIDAIDLPESEFYVQGTNLVDINTDGWLDLFVCNDEGENKVYENDGTGKFRINNDWFDFSQEEEDMSSGNYGSVWSDVDNDGLVDLYISKCKASVTSEEDQRRVNQLFLNNSDGKFYNKAEECFMDLGAQSWVTDFGDIDNDGDMDAFVANHDRPSQLMINNDGYFTDYTDSMGVAIQGLIIQSKLVDLDNDGLLDIIVCGTSDMIYRNLGNYKFEKVSGISSVNTITSYAIGDINDDGFVDLYACYPQGFVNPNVYPDQLYMNRPNGNHYVTFSLEGTSDNRSGIGSRLYLYGPWGMQMRELKIGEGYGVTNSSRVHFGLGVHNQIDSLVIKWPSGSLEKITGLSADDYYHITQGGCKSSRFNIIAQDNETRICEGDSVVLFTDVEGYVAWNNNVNQDTINVKQTGVYAAATLDSLGCSMSSDNILVEVNPVEQAIITLSDDTLLCQGDQLKISVLSFDQVMWNTGALLPSIVVEHSGFYSASVEGLCETLSSDTISVRFLEADAPEIVWEDTIAEPKNIIFQGMGSVLNWYLNENDAAPIFTGPEWEIRVDESTTFFVENVQRFAGSVSNIGIKEPTGTNVNHNVNFNGQLIFDVYDKLKLESVDVYTDVPGERTITHKSSKLTQSKTVQLDSGKNTVILNFDLLPDINNRLSTDEDKNLEVFGTKSPKLYRTSTSSGALAYPYGPEGFLQIKQSNFENNYYYFYNWKVSREDIYCVSDRIPLDVVFNQTTSQQNLDQIESIVIYPNPAGDILYFKKLSDHEIEILELLDVTGKVIQRIVDPMDRAHLNLSGITSGMYGIKVYGDFGTQIKKLLKIR